MRRKKDAKKTDRKRGVSFQEKYNKEEEGEERRRGKGGRDNKGGIERLEHYSGVNPLNLISVRKELTNSQRGRTSFKVRTPN